MDLKEIHGTHTEGLKEALETGPYGKCVYQTDNDVVDHQVVNMEFENEATASFTMNAFTKDMRRETRICGTRLLNTAFKTIGMDYWTFVRFCLFLNFPIDSYHFLSLIGSFNPY